MNPDPISDETFDVALIGGGVIGCATAWRLAEAGLRVVVIERGEAGREASWAAGGMLAPLSEADERDAFLDLALASRALYADLARELHSATGIDIEYRTEGTLYLSLSSEDDEELERRWEYQRAAGLSTERLSAASVLALEPQITPGVRWALRFPEDHQVDNRRLMKALVAAARRSGVRLLTHTEALGLRIEHAGGKMRAAGALTTRGEVRARAVVITAGCWSGLLAGGEPIALSAVPVAPVRGQMVALSMPAPEVRHVIYSRRGYIIPRLGGYLIAGSTSERAGYDKRVTAGGLSAIIAHATEIIPAAKSLPVVETWAGLRPFAGDGRPILGADPQVAGLYYSTGHYRNGILLAPISARAISDLITRGESRDDISAFSITRFADHAAAG